MAWWLGGGLGNNYGGFHIPGPIGTANAGWENNANSAAADAVVDKGKEVVKDVVESHGGQVVENPNGDDNTANNENVFGNDVDELLKNATNSEKLQWKAFEEQMKFNEREAERSREWQEHMFDNQFKKTVEGLKKAGLNPTLLFGNGMNGEAFNGATAHSGTSNFVTQNRTKTQEKAELLDLFKIITNAAVAIGLGKRIK